MMKHLTHIFVVVFLFLPGVAQSHFLTDSQSREIHLVPTEAGAVELWMRFPLTFAYATELAARVSPDAAIEAPFLVHELVAGQPFYSLDTAAASENRAAFANVLMRNFDISVDGRAVEPEVREVAVVSVPQGSKPPTGRSELDAILRDGEALASGYVSELAVVLAATVPDLGAGNRLSVEIAAPRFLLPESLHVSNRYADHRSNPPQTVTQEGFWPSKVTLSGNPLAGFVHFIGQGVIHILFGLDHLLFVICLALAASGWWALVVSVTGFTLGHSVTLSAGVLGYLPRSDWFIPAVEFGVALSIVAMAVLVLVRRSGPMGFGIAAGLGLLHGFGFAFMLSPMLGESGLLLPLAGFNLGVELGQLLIVIPLVGALMLVDRMTPMGGRAVRYATAGAAVLVALIWSYERADSIVAALTPVAGSGA